MRRGSALMGFASKLFRKGKHYSSSRNSRTPSGGYGQESDLQIVISSTQLTKSKSNMNSNGVLEVNKIDPERNVLLNGFANPRAEVMMKHPLEIMEKTYRERMEAIDLTIARRVQGLHAPLRLMMERKAASNVGRLPFLPSSNLMKDTLEDRNEFIDFEDIFNDPTHIEAMGPPHMVMERKLGLL